MDKADTKCPAAGSHKAVDTALERSTVKPVGGVNET